MVFTLLRSAERLEAGFYRAERVGFEPTDSFRRHLLSREARSTGLRHLSRCRKTIQGGGGGIRTPGELPLNGFQDRRIRPLCHPSREAIERLVVRLPSH